MPGTTTQGNRVRLLHDGAECLPAMLQAIAGASREILLEMYWFASDATGQSFATALEERARAGVRVCVTYDAFGSYEADHAMFERMREAGCGVYEFNPPTLWRLRRFNLARWNRRNHRKLLVIDGRIGFTGGVNLGDPWAAVEHGGYGFRDDMIEVEGPAARAMRAVMLGTYRGPHRVEALAEPLGSHAPVGKSVVQVLANDFRARKRVIERAYLDRIRDARSRIVIANSYFLPGMLMRRALGGAVMRGVRVQVLLPGESDVPMVQHAMRRLYGGMMRRGIEIHEWGLGILHSKVAVVDGRWCTVGTHNLDRRSWAYNLEVNAMIDDPEVARALLARLERDLAGAVRVDPRVFQFRALGMRLLELFFYVFHRLL
jgi:cardiolipin synthase